MAEEMVGAAARLLVWLGRFLFELLYGFFYGTGRMGLPLLTFGWWRGIALTDQKSQAGLFGKRQPDGTRLFDEEAGVVFGVLIWVLIGLLISAALRVGSLL